MGYINEDKIIQMRRLNKIDNCDVTENDVKKAVHIYGKSIECLKGNSNGKKGEPVKFEPQLPLRADIQRSQMCSMDIMQIGKQISLVTVTTPLEMTFIKRLISKNEKDLREAIINQINKIDRKGFKVEKLIWDSESSIRGEGLTSRIKGRVNNFKTFEPGRHVARVERKIQRIKKMFRAVKTSSVNEWDSNMDSACVNYCILI